MKRLALASLLAACATPRSPSGASASSDLAWIASPKLGSDEKEFLIRAHDEDLVFPFVLDTHGAGLDPDAMERLRAIGIAPDWSGDGGKLRCKPAQVALLVAEPGVDAVMCGTSVLTGREAWEAEPLHHARIDPDVRVIMGAEGGCWIDVLLRFDRPMGSLAKETYERLPGAVKAFDATSAIVWVPIRMLYAISTWDGVASIERAPRP